MAFDAFEFVGSKSKTPLTSFRYANAPFFGAQVKQQPGDFQSFAEPLKILYGPDISKWPVEAKNKTLELYQGSISPDAQLSRAVSSPVAEILSRQAYEMSPEGRKELLEMTRQHEFEKGKAGLLFNTLSKLPEAMAAAVNPFGGPVGAAMAYQGASAIPGIYAQTMASFPQIQVPGYSAQQYRYFQ